MSEQNNAMNNGNNNILMGIIIVLLIIIAVGAFFIGKQSAQQGSDKTPVVGQQSIEGLTVTLYTDDRCTNCKIPELTSSLKQIPVLANIEFGVKNFTDEGVKEYLETNNITKLPAVIFNKENVDTNINSYLTKLPSEEYSLNVNASFDPFVERSANGFLLLDTVKLAEIKSNSYVKGNVDAKITWLEYSDLECPYCAKLHNSTTPDDLTEKYGDDLNIIFHHFPLEFHANAQTGAEILECVGEVKGSDAFYTLMKTSYTATNSTKSFLLDEAEKLGVNKSTLETCLSDKKYTDKVTSQMATGTEIFGVTGTPGNVLINNQTGEYEVLSGAYPTENFVSIIDKLLK